MEKLKLFKINPVNWFEIWKEQSTSFGRALFEEIFAVTRECSKKMILIFQGL